MRIRNLNRVEYIVEEADRQLLMPLLSLTSSRNHFKRPGTGLGELFLIMVAFVSVTLCRVPHSTYQRLSLLTRQPAGVGVPVARDQPRCRSVTDNCTHLTHTF